MDSSLSLNNFKQDRVFAAFLGDSFNLQGTIASINNLPPAEQLAKIASGIEYVKHSISLLTSQNCEEFFQRTSKLEDLYQELQFIQVKSQNLAKTLDLIRSKLEVPYNQLLRQIALISRLQKTCDLLRKMLRIIHLSKRVYECNLEAFKHEHEHTIYLKEIVKVSQYINEVDLIISSDEEKLLFRLKLTKKDLTRIAEIKSSLILETDQLLATSLATPNGDSNVISTALQVFHNLGILNEKLNGLVSEKCTHISQTVNKSLSVRELKGVKQNVHIGPNSALRTTLRNSVKSMLDSVASHFNQVGQVIRLLKKRRDNFSQTLLIEFIDNKETILGTMWARVAQSMSSLITKQVNESAGLKQLIESDYPNVLLIFLDFWRAINQANEAEHIGTEKSLRSIILNFESAYLSSSLSTLFDSVNRIFKDAKESSKSSSSKVVSVPSEKDVDTLIRCINHELSMASLDAMLIQSVCKNVFQTINLFMVKCENLTLVDGDSTQVIGSFTASQRHNSLIVHILSFFARQISASLASYKNINQVEVQLEKALASIDNLILTVFEPLINSIQDAIESILLTMYSEDYGISSSNKSDDVSCSLYMKEMQRFISRVSQDYLRQFAQSTVIEKRVSQMASTTIDAFLLYVSLLSPVSSVGRRKIAADMNQLELAIVPICERMGDLGRSYQILRAFKTLLPLTPEEISQSSVLGYPVPFYLILHFLISNYAPEELKTPPKYMDWSVTRYIKWLNSSTDQQRVAMINDVLDSYVKQVRKSQKTTFAPIYPILVGILKRALSEQ